MTPLQFAKEQCANYRPEGCAGIGIRDNGELYSFGAKPRCVLGTPGVRCSYFEECVMPMGSEDPRVRAERNEAIRLYRVSSNAPKAPQELGRICPVCQRRELEPRRRLCYVCAAESRRKSQRAANTRRQGLDYNS